MTADVSADQLQPQLNLQPMVESYRQRRSSGLSGLSLRFDASFGSGAVRPITCRYGLSRGVCQQEVQSPPSSASSTPSSAGSKSPFSQSADSSDIVRVAKDRFTRKEVTSNSLADAHQALSETFTLDSNSPTLASLSEQWRHPQTTSNRHLASNTTDVMRRLGGDRKLRPVRPHGPRNAMLVRGHGLSQQAAARAPGDSHPPGIGHQDTTDEHQTPSTHKLSQSNRERQRIRATIVSMRNEVMGATATDSPPPGTRSSGLLEEAAIRGSRMRHSRELRLTGGVQSTSEPSGYAHKLAAPQRALEMSTVPPTASQEFFTRAERRVVREAPSTQPVTQSALGFDSWSVRRPSLSTGTHQQPEPVTSSPLPTEEQRQRFDDLEIVDDDAMGELLSDFHAKAGKAVSVGRSPVKGAPITEQEGCRLKELLFGSTSVSFTPEWTRQGLTFNKAKNISYGIVQNKGGPCGVLAALQAYIVKVLLFGSELCGVSAVSDVHQPSGQERAAALTAAIAEMLWKCGHGTTVTVALSSGRAHFAGGGRYKSDGITETLQLQQFSSMPPLVAYIRDHLHQFQADAGCVLLTYSAILSRSVDSVRYDMDVATSTVIGRHGYCTQELVNLLLTGSAVSNVFNGTVRLGDGPDIAELRGVDQRSEIGLLSLFEHYKSCEVGSHLKSPQLPIWVILSESHFTCLFAADRRLCQRQPAAGTFDLFYYDMLARQDDQIRLTVEYGGDCTADPPLSRDGELVPPLEHCLRTRWPGAAVGWNGYEPIL